MCASSGSDVPSKVAAESGTPLRTRLRFPRGQRLTNSGCYDAVFAEKRRAVGRLIVLWARPNGGPEWRLGAIASKRTLRRSVDRNRAKRLIREAFRLAQHDLPGAYDGVVIARRFILRASEKDVRDELVGLARSVNKGGGEQ